MQEELNFLLQKNALFSSLPPEERLRLMPKFSRLVLLPNEILFHQNDPADGIYLVYSGSLSAYIRIRSDKIKITRRIHAGEAIGEMAALGKMRRPISIKAQTTCVLYKLSTEDFLAVCARFPGLVFQSLQPVISRLHKIEKLLTPSKTNKSIVLVPAHATSDIHDFIQAFTKASLNFHSIILISEFSTEFGKDSKNALIEKIEALENNKQPNQRTIYLLKSCQSALAHAAFKKSKSIYVIAKARDEVRIEPPLIQILSAKKSRAVSKNIVINLILLHEPQTLFPQNTQKWLAQFPFNLHHHLRIDVKKHYTRLLRFIRGKAIGLVLGGGGTRGYAHLGALKAIQEEKTPLDYVAGTSVGAIIAACFALQESYTQAFAIFDKIVQDAQKSVSWLSLTWPIISIFNGTNFTEALKKAFLSHQIEDLWLPYFCISSNLSHYQEQVHTTGSLFEKLRASASVPGIIPPMVLKGEIHFDGGLLNNLPVDVMRHYLGPKAKIIAVELTGSMHDSHMYSFPPGLSLKESILLKLRWINPKYIFPSFIDIFLRGLLIGSSVRAKQNGLLATILVDLRLRRYNLLHTNEKQSAKMLEMGYVETLTRLRQYKNRKLDIS